MTGVNARSERAEIEAEAALALAACPKCSRLSAAAKEGRVRSIVTDIERTRSRKAQQDLTANGQLVTLTHAA